MSHYFIMWKVMHIHCKKEIIEVTGVQKLYLISSIWFDASFSLKLIWLSGYCAVFSAFTLVNSSSLSFHSLSIISVDRLSISTEPENRSVIRILQLLVYLRKRSLSFVAKDVRANCSAHPYCARKFTRHVHAK